MPDRSPVRVRTRFLLDGAVLHVCREDKMKRAWFVVVAVVVLLSVTGRSTAQDLSTQSDFAPLGYKGGYVMSSEDGKFQLRLTAGIQMRYTYVDYDHEVVGNESDYSNFFIRRARLWMVGYAYDPRLTYLIHLQLEPTSQVNAHDLWLQYTFSDLLRLGAGRNKIAYGLEFLNSGMALELVDRSILSGETDIERGAGLLSEGPTWPGGGSAEFGLASSSARTGFATGGLNLYRSQGVQLSGRRGGDDRTTFEYQAGIWEGRATRGSSNRGTGHLVALRVGWHPWGFVDWTRQGDRGRSPTLRVGFFASAYTNREELGGGYDEHGLDLAVASRWRGLAIDVEWSSESFDYDAFADPFDRRGWRVQGGYMVAADRVEIILRHAEVERLLDPTAQRAVDSGLGLVYVDGADGPVNALESRLTEWTAGAAYSLSGDHRQRIVADVSRLGREFAPDPAAGIAQAAEQVDYRLRTMVQLMF
jgi:hypothetical protein